MNRRYSTARPRFLALATPLGLQHLAILCALVLPRSALGTVVPHWCAQDLVSSGCYYALTYADFYYWNSPGTGCTTDYWQLRVHSCDNQCEPYGGYPNWSCGRTSCDWAGGESCGPNPNSDTCYGPYRSWMPDQVCQRMLNGDRPSWILESTCGKNACPPVCGDDLCNGGETCRTCALDCGSCCGNGTCEEDLGEDCRTCQRDCGSCCGNGVCEKDLGENCDTCHDDCPNCCGDGTCAGPPLESCYNCPGDCGRCDLCPTGPGGEKCAKPGTKNSPEEGDEGTCDRQSETPVDGYTGFLIVGPTEDIRLKGAADDDLFVVRNYSSGRHGQPTTARNPVGDSWAFNMNVHFLPADSTDPMHTMVREDGRGYRFDPSGNDATGAGWRVTESYGVGWKVNAADGREYNFDVSGRLTSRRSRTGTAVQYVYDSVSGRLTHVVNASNYLYFQYYEGRLHRVWLGNPWRTLVIYGYTGELLTSVCYGADCSGERWEYTYGGGVDGKLLTEVWHGGVLEEKHVYCAQAGDCATGSSHQVRRSFTPTQRLVFTYNEPACRGTVVEDLNADPPLRKACLTWDADGYLLTRDTPAGCAGSAGTYQWSGPHFGALARKVALTGGLNGDAWTSRTHDDRKRLWTETENATGFAGSNPPSDMTRTTTYGYTDLANPSVPTSISRPGVGGTVTTTIAYNPVGLVTERHEKVTSPAGALLTDVATYTDYQNSSKGIPKLKQIAGPIDLAAGEAKVYHTVLDHYDDAVTSRTAGRLWKVKRYPSCPAGRCAPEIVEQEYLDYDDYGRPSWVKDANKLETKTTYDQFGRVLDIVRLLPSGGSTTTSTRYDKAGRIQLVTDVTSGVGTHYYYETFSAPAGAAGFSRLKAITRLASAGAADNTLRAGLERTIYAHDAQGNVIEEATYANPSAALYSGTLARRAVREYEHGRIARLLAADGTTTIASMIYDPLTGVLHNRTDYSSLNESHTTTYDYQWGRLWTVDGTTYSYDMNGNVKSVKDELQRVSSFTYDDLGRLLASTTPSGGTSTFTYTGRGNLHSRTDGAGRSVTYSHDALGRLLTELGGHDGQVDYTYDDPYEGYHGLGRLTSVSDTAGDSQLGYDELGRLRFEARLNAGAGRSSRTYLADLRANGTPWAIQYPDGSRLAVSQSTVDTDRIGEIQYLPPQGSQWQALASHIGWGPGGRLASLTYGNDAMLARSQTTDGAPYEIAVTDPVQSGAWLWRAQYPAVDYQGRPKQILRTGPGMPASTESYTYDSYGRLDRALISPPLDGRTDDFRYGYSNSGGGGERVGNRTSQDRRGPDYFHSQTSYALGAASSLGTTGADDRLRMSRTGEHTTCWDYDGSGALTREGYGTTGTSVATGCASPAWAYCAEYDDWGRVKAAGAAGAHGSCQPYWQYGYDYKGRRVTISGQGAFADKQIDYYYDLSDLLVSEIAITASGEQPLQSYYYLAGEPLALARADGTLLFFHNDHLGTPQRLSKLDGTIKWAARLSPFGELGWGDINAAEDCESPVDQPLRFPGQYDDPRRGTGFWTYNYHRYYDPAVGRYTQVDPVLSQAAIHDGQQPRLLSMAPRPTQAPGSLSAYGYAGSDPVGFVDPSGLMECRSGRCPDCRSGFWAGLFGFCAGGAIVGLPGAQKCCYDLKCVGSSARRFVCQTCMVLIGGGAASFEAVRPYCIGAFCYEDFDGYSYGSFATGGAKGASIGMQFSISGSDTTIVKPPICWAASVGVGVGKGVGVTLCFTDQPGQRF